MLTHMYMELKIEKKKCLDILVRINVEKKDII